MKNLEVRSVIKQGDSLAVTIPAKWCEELDIEKGSKVGMEKSGSIVEFRKFKPISIEEAKKKCSGRVSRKDWEDLKDKIAPYEVEKEVIEEKKRKLSEVVEKKINELLEKDEIRLAPKKKEEVRAKA